MNELKEKIKNILSIVYIWELILLLPSILFVAILGGDEPYPDFSIAIILTETAFFIVLPFVIALVYFPTILVLWFINRKLKNKKWLTLWAGFLIPLTNLIYYYIESIVEQLNKPLDSMLIGFYAFLFAFWTIIFSLLTPKKYLQNKMQIALAASLSIIFGVIMILSIDVIDDVALKLFPEINYTYYNSKISKELKAYDPLINELEMYHSKHGIYPKDSIDYEKSYKYELKNNGKSYVIETHFDNQHGDFLYCSDKKDEECKLGYDEYGNKVKQIGKWYIRYYE